MKPVPLRTTTYDTDLDLTGDSNWQAIAYNQADNQLTGSISSSDKDNGHQKGATDSDNSKPFIGHSQDGHVPVSTRLC